MKKLILVFTILGVMSNCQKERDCICTVTRSWTDTTGKDSTRTFEALHTVNGATKKRAQAYCQFSNNKTEDSTYHPVNSVMTRTVVETNCKVK